MIFQLLNNYLFANNLISSYQDNKLIFLYIIVINIITLLLYGFDKIKAMRNKWRIPESVLLTASIIGGSLGALLAMKIFNHKTKKAKFYIGIPIILIIHIIGLLYFMKSFPR